jgi:hypothetical protein
MMGEMFSACTTPDVPRMYDVFKYVFAFCGS